MRLVILSTVSALCIALLSACASAAATTNGLRQASSGPECPETEGYPDCQDGHQVDLTAF